MLTEVLACLEDETGAAMTKKGRKAPAPNLTYLLVEIGQRIRLARVEAGLSQEDLRRLAGLGLGDTVSRIELGRQNLSVSMLGQIAIALNVPVADFFAPSGAAIRQPPLPPEDRLEVMQATLDALVAASPVQAEIEATIAAAQRRVVRTRAEAMRVLAEAEQIEAEAERREERRPRAANGDSDRESPPPQ